MLKGYRTYISIALMVFVGALQQMTVLSSDVTTGLLALLGALAAYFRSQA